TSSSTNTPGTNTYVAYGTSYTGQDGQNCCLSGTNDGGGAGGGGGGYYGGTQNGLNKASESYGKGANPGGNGVIGDLTYTVDTNTTYTPSYTSSYSTGAGPSGSIIITYDEISSGITFGGTVNGANNLTTVVTNGGETTFSGIVGGSSAVGAIDITGALNLDAAITSASSISVSTTSNLGASVTTSGTQTYTGAVTLTNDVILTSTASNMSYASIDGAYDLTMIAGSALTLTGDIGGSTALDTVDISTTSGNLTLSGDITVSSTGSDAIVINAGSDTAAGTATGGNIIVSGTPTYTTGSGGLIKLYSGSVSSSTGLTSFVSSGSHRFRYNSDESDTNYSAALISGKYAIYREQPTLTITADDETITYGTAPAETVTITGMVNGDSSATVVTTAASISIAGDTSTSNNYIVGDHTITPSAAASTYGYALSYSTGTLTVDAKPITITGITAANKVYDSNTTAT
ncbi:MAG: hypothetical protein EBY41_06730, partial [Proteobacteria bacterium]|nr:hypothetical protein [Pseudomonadota bacterium]